MDSIVYQNSSSSTNRQQHENNHIFKLSNDIVKELLNNFESTKQVNYLLSNFITKQPLAINSLVNFYQNRIQTLEQQQQQHHSNTNNNYKSQLTSNNGSTENSLEMVNDENSNHQNTTSNVNNSFQCAQENDWKLKYDQLYNELQLMKSTVFQYDQLKSNIEMHIGDQFIYMQDQYLSYINQFRTNQEKIYQLYIHLSNPPLINVQHSNKNNNNTQVEETIIDMDSLQSTSQQERNFNQFICTLDNTNPMPNVQHYSQPQPTTNDFHHFINIFNSTLSNFKLMLSKSDQSFSEMKKYLDQYSESLQDYTSLERYSSVEPVIVVKKEITSPLRVNNQNETQINGNGVIKMELDSEVDGKGNEKLHDVFLKLEEKDNEILRLRNELKYTIEMDQDMMLSMKQENEQQKQEIKSLKELDIHKTNLVDSLTANLVYFTSNGSHQKKKSVNSNNNGSNANSLEIDDDDDQPSSQKEFFEKERQNLQDRIKELEVENANLLSSNQLTSLRDQIKVLTEDIQIIQHEKTNAEMVVQQLLNHIKSLKMLVSGRDQDSSFESGGGDVTSSSPPQSSSSQSGQEDDSFLLNYIDSSSVSILNDSGTIQWLKGKIRKLLNIQKQMEGNRNQFTSVENELNQLRAQFIHIQQELNDSSLVIHSQSENNKSLNMEIMMLSSDKDELNNTIHIRNQEIQQLKKDLENIKNELQDEKQGVLVLEEQKMVLENKVRDYSDVQVKNHASSLKMVDDLNSATNRYLQLEAELMIEQEKVSKIPLLEAKILELKQQISQERESQQSNTKDLVSTREQLMELNNKINDQNEEIQLLFKEKSEAQIALVPLRDKIEQLQQSLQTFDSMVTDYNDLKQLYKEKIDNYDHLNIKYQDRKNELSTLKLMSDGINEKLKTLELESDKKESEMNRLKFDLQTSTDQLTKKEKLYDSNLKQNVQLEKENKEMKKLLDNYQNNQSQHNDIQNAMAQELNQKLLDSRTLYLEQFKQNQALKDKFDILISEKEKLDRDLVETVSERDKLRQSIEVLKSIDNSASGKDAEIRKLKKEIEFFKEQLISQSKNSTTSITTTNTTNNSTTTSKKATACTNNDFPTIASNTATNDKKSSPSKKRTNEVISTQLSTTVLIPSNNLASPTTTTNSTTTTSSSTNKKLKTQHISSSAISSSIKPYILSLTGFKEESEDEKQNLIKIIKSLGGDVKQNDFDSSITHVVSNSTSTTMKTISAVLTHKWVVSPQWIYDSEQSGHFLPETDYGQQFNVKPLAGKKFFLSESFKNSKAVGNQTVTILITVIGRGTIEKDESSAEFILVANDWKNPDPSNTKYMTWNQFLALVPQPNLMKKKTSPTNTASSTTS
ncbi:hypothetical protein DLAC_10911 [Tieghemostelium lacteum]|uniref:BRCT domain-containing protein n=1 Tax=Tieghemostelium lacteum TaxID=361077 RepID=A0A151Z2N5_TIELA|nr:hypothetical protein DLAC_10911 [Tieghemostelium lacteum]|eukprot:KYQ88226.1 hypothetical protein DLAC_10911 [Tieghemostelium lacteum]